MDFDFSQSIKIKYHHKLKLYKLLINEYLTIKEI